MTVNVALLPLLRAHGWDIHYVGSHHGIERELIAYEEDVTYHPISTGKFRRYVTWRHVQEPFLVLQGMWQAQRLLQRIRPNVVFSKGGFVSVPVVFAAQLGRIPVVLHESDVTPGLANRVCAPLATTVCTTFPETHLRQRKGRVVPLGAVLRPTLWEGRADIGRQYCGFAGKKPVLLVMGGSLGARRINEAVRNVLGQLLPIFDVIHLCGKGNVDRAFQQTGYRQFDYVHAELPHLLAATDLVVSRAGSNAIHEFLGLRKPMLLIPLTREVSRGDQIQNAQSFLRRGYAHVLEEGALVHDPQALFTAIQQVYRARIGLLQCMERVKLKDAVAQLYRVIEQDCR